MSSVDLSVLSMSKEERIARVARKNYAASNIFVRNFNYYDLQKEIEVWQQKNFGGSTICQLALGVGEEIGELVHCILKRSQGIRGFDDEWTFLAKAGDAIADATVYMMSLSNMLELDFDRQVITRLNQNFINYYGSFSDERLGLRALHAAGKLADIMDTRDTVPHRITEHHVLQDLVSILISICRNNYLNYHFLVEGTTLAVLKRDWTANPENAHLVAK